MAHQCHSRWDLLKQPSCNAGRKVPLAQEAAGTVGSGWPEQQTPVGMSSDNKVLLPCLG